MEIAEAGGGRLRRSAAGLRWERGWAEGGWGYGSAGVLGLLLGGLVMPGQVGQGTGAYRLRVAVDEVGLTFQARDARGAVVTDLRADEVRVLDDGRPARRVVSFSRVEDLPVRVGFLMDTSASVGGSRAAEREVAQGFAKRLAEGPADRAFVMNFDASVTLTQGWTNSVALLAGGIRNRRVAEQGETVRHGTAMLNALYQACRSVFGQMDGRASGRAILLFSDGNDNASQTTQRQVVEACQAANTAIYAFRAPEESELYGDGASVLTELARETGGRVFPGVNGEVETEREVQELESDLRSQYRLVYQPAELRADGSFHQVVVLGPERVATVEVRSGYYAVGR